MEYKAATEFFFKNYYEEKKTIVQTMQEFPDQQNATLIAEHRVMKEALQRIEAAKHDVIDYTGTVRDSLETLKNITL